jgi:2-polyprenyl-3-methyl-5-hydroxy-6-metoxy-1,4-benzoquinol methylase
MDSSMNMNRPRLLVAIASYGLKNLEYLKGMIRRYKALPMEVHIVVLSEAPKDLGDDVEVVVGLPSQNPWSLPFAHKPIFAKRLEQYDLFVYTEDDMEVTEQNIDAFLRVSAVLESDEIAGYLRYEIGSGETMVLTDVHGPYHWRPESVRRRGAHTVAEFTNEHAAFYLLTQAQLRKAIASGGFLCEPYEGRHDMLCAAATDPYTSCGFRKVVCISELRNFLIRHMSNLYVNRHGVTLSAFEDQVQTLTKIRDGAHPATTLCETETKMRRLAWSKSYYEAPSEELLRLVPGEAKTILSIGCGWGVTEASLKERGAQVTALPLDSVIGAVAARHGIELIYGSLSEAWEKLKGRTFDCVLVTNLLHLQANPTQFLRRCTRAVRAGGSIILSGPNFDRLPTWVRRTLGVGDCRKLRSYDDSRINVCGSGMVRRQLEGNGFRVVALHWLNHTLPSSRLSRVRVAFGRLTANDWILQARRTKPCD